MLKKVKGSMMTGGIFFLVSIVFSSLILLNTAHAQTVRITFPNGGEVWTAGENKNITWTFSGAAADAKVELVLLQGWKQIGVIISNISIGSGGNGSWSWKVGQYQGGSLTSGSGYKIRMKIVGRDWVWDESDQPFSLVRASVSTSDTAVKADSQTVKPKGYQQDPGTMPKAVEAPPDFSFERIYYNRLHKKLEILVRNNGANYKGPLEVFVQYKHGNYIQLEKTITRNFQNFPSNFTEYFIVEFEWPQHFCGCSFLIKIDPQNKIVERNKSNNIFQGNISQMENGCIKFFQEDGRANITIKSKGNYQGAEVAHHIVTHNENVYLSASYVTYDPMFRIAYLDVSFLVENCGGTTISPDITYSYYTHPDNNVLHTTDNINNIPPGGRRYIKKRIAVKIRQGNFLEIQFSKPCQAYSSEWGEYFRVNFRFKDDFIFY